MNKIGFAFSVVRNGKDTWSEAFTNRKAPGQLWLDPSWQALNVGIVLNSLLYLNFGAVPPEIRHGGLGEDFQACSGSGKMVQNHAAVQLCETSEPIASAVTGPKFRQLSS
jgi:hypothetical protein